jgi:hypothetical protein
MNAKYELLEILGEVDTKIKCALITYEPDEVLEQTFILKSGYNKATWQDFLSQLDFEYDDGFGLQELHGCIWLNDGAWLARREHDGAENWEHQTCPSRHSRKQCPPIPPELLEQQKGIARWVKCFTK